MNKSRLIKLLTTFVCKFIKEKGYISSHVWNNYYLLTIEWRNVSKY
jgi:hypothetical protein